MKKNIYNFKNMNRLTEIANKYVTDKGDSFREKHSFTYFYEDYFSKYKNPNILEIGIDTGASLKMYNEFYDGKCQIYAIDILDKSYLNTDNIHTFIVDQGSREQLQKFVESIKDIKFDIILDDGSHDNGHQQISLLYLYKLLKPSGIYIIEDLHATSHNKQDSTLYSLAFRENFKYLTNEENNLLNSKIDKKLIWAYNNDYAGYCNKSSITSILTFKE